MNSSSAFRDLILGIAEIYRTEGRDGGDLLADRLLSAALAGVNPGPAATPYLQSELIRALDLSTLPITNALRSALPVISWQHAGLADGRIDAPVAEKMLTAELIGPTGLIFDTTVRAGVFMQASNVDYTTRVHGAEETYYPLTDTAKWSLNGALPVSKPAGQFIFHPSMAPHATFTGNMPLLALWRWSGDIGWDSYIMEATG